MTRSVDWRAHLFIEPSKKQQQQIGARCRECISVDMRLIAMRIGSTNKTVIMLSRSKKRQQQENLSNSNAKTHLKNMLHW